MAREKYQTRLPADMAEKVDEYRDEHDISQAEAVRRLIDAGLEVERDDGENEKMVFELGNDETDDETEVAQANFNHTAGQTGTILMILMLVFLTAAEVGLI